MNAQRSVFVLHSPRMDKDTVVFSRFEKVKKDGTKEKFRIQTGHEDDFDKLISFMMSHYVYEEKLAIITRIPESKEAIEEMKRINRSVFEETGGKYCLVCYLDEDGETEIVGCNILMLISKDDSDDFPELETQPVKDFFKIMDLTSKLYDPLKAENIDKYLAGIGRSVHPNYRGCGIALEILKARMDEDLVVYSRFEKVKNDGTKIKLRVQKPRKRDVDKLFEFMMTHYVYEELFSKMSGIPQTKESMDELLWLYKLGPEEDACNYNLMCCIDTDGDTEIVGCNCLMLFTNEDNDEFPELKTKQVKDFFRIMDATSKFYDPLKAENIEKYLAGIGLSVHPDYRGCGIALEILKARKPLLQELSISCTGAWFTSLASQKTAERAGYVEVASITSEELGKATGLMIDGDIPPTLKYFLLKI